MQLDPFQGGKLIFGGQVESASVVSLLSLRETQWPETVVEINIDHRRPLNKIKLQTCKRVAKRRTRETLWATIVLPLKADDTP
jgi:hypothetical protein